MRSVRTCADNIFTFGGRHVVERSVGSAEPPEALGDADDASVVDDANDPCRPNDGKRESCGERAGKCQQNRDLAPEKRSVS